MTRLKDAMILLLILAAVFISGTICGRWSGKSATPEQRDTVFVEKVKYYSRAELKPSREYSFNRHFRSLTKMVFCDFLKIDTVHIHDTTFLILPRQYREYRGDDYFALVSGIDPTLDSLSFSSKDMVIDSRPDFKRNFLSIYAEPTWMGHFHLPVGVSYEYMPMNWLGVGGSAGYDFISRQPFLSAKMRISFGW